jgi:putative transcriptional regulator
VNIKNNLIYLKLKKSGLVDEITMKNIQSLCIPAVKKYKPEKNCFFKKEI